MAVSNVNSVMPGGNAPNDLSRVPMKVLGQNDFLQLLVTELTTQDPLNPRKDSEFIAQMAQFSSLEQAKDLTNKVDQLEKVQQLSTAAELIGRKVEVRTAEGSLVQGQVSEVRMFSDGPGLVVDDKVYDLDQVQSVMPASATTQATKPSTKQSATAR